MRRGIVGYAVLILRLTTSCAQDLRRSNELADTLGLYQAGCEAIDSFDIEVHITTTAFVRREGTGLVRLSESETAASRSIRISRQQLDGVKYRADLLRLGNTDYPTGTSTTIWNGENSIAYLAAKQRGSLTPQYRAAVGHEGIPFTTLYRDYSLDYSYISLFNDRPDLTSASHSAGLIVVTAKADPRRLLDRSNRMCRLFLDPQHGYLPARIEQFVVTAEDGDRARLWTVFENELASIDGIYAPRKSKKTVYEIDRTSPHFGGALAVQELALNMDRTRFNADVDDSLFGFSFPAGTEVRDDLRNTRYLVGSERKETYLKRLAASGRRSIETLQQSPSKRLYSTSITRSPFRRIMLALNVALGVFIAILGIRHFVKRKRAMRSS